MCIIHDSGGYWQDFYPYRSQNLIYYSGDSIGDLKCVSISIYDDTRVENDIEYFYLTISSGPRAIINQDQRRIRINIHDNDGIGPSNCLLRSIQ